MRAVVASLVITSLLAACATDHQVFVTGRTLHHGLINLRADGKAKVEATDLVEGEGRSHEVTVAMGDRLVLGGKPVILADLTLDCPDLPPFDEDHASAAHCGLVQHRNDRFTLRDYTTFSAGRVIRPAVAILILGLAAGSAACIGLCADDGQAKEASEIGLISAGVGLLGLLLLSCAGKWGQPGCRD